MYVCGPTTYNLIHLGNARPLVVFDTVRRYLIYKGYEVTYVQNFTDVDDKIINRAIEEGITAQALAEKYIQEYFKDAEALGVLKADVHPRVSEHIGDIIEAIEILLKKGYAYTVDGDVYFRVQSFPEYGRLSGRDLEDMMVGARVEVDERKENPMDFALWKKAKPGEPYWESPWGAGRPGWHIECSVMSMKYLGQTIDIHGGGADLIFPHHENEIAQSEALTGHPFVKYWMHNGFITVNKEKMSKSLGNFFILRDILEHYPPYVVRFYLLSTHYRSPLDFDDEKLQEAKKAVDRLVNCLEMLKEAISQGEQKSLGPEDQEFLAEINLLQTQFMMAMDDDFNTALALSHLFSMARLINTYLHEKARNLEVLKRAEEVFSEFLNILGLRLLPEGDDELTRVLTAVLTFRDKARKEKDFATADAIREMLQELGVVVEDSKDGFRYRITGKVKTEHLRAKIRILLKRLENNQKYGQVEELQSLLLSSGIVNDDKDTGMEQELTK